MKRKPIKEVISHETLKLDIAENRKSPRGSNRLQGVIRSIMITDSNSSKVNAYAFFEETQERVRLKLGVPVNFDEPRQGCVLEWEAQSGIWMDIQTSAKTHFTISQLNVESVGSSFASGGINFEQTLKDVSNTASDLIPANEQRVLTRAENRGVSTWYIGTLENCTDPDYQKKCEAVEPGGEVIWDLTCALYVRTASTTDVEGMYYFEQLKG